jgi:WD40 repeat protein
MPADPLDDLPTLQWQRVHLTARRFEEAWRSGARPSLNEHLSAAGGGLALLRELVLVDLEHRLRAGEAARAEDYLARYPELAARPDLAAELLAAERRAGTPLHAQPTLINNPATQAAGPPPPQRPDALATLPGYRVLEEIGRGGLGVVYRAVQESVGRVVALKVVLAGAHADAAHRARLQQEALAAGRLSHPHIVTLYEAGEHAGLPYLAMELVAGPSLARLLGAGPLRPADAARLAEPLARALHHAHAQGVVHRDLKPANVLLAARGFTESALAKPQAAEPKPQAAEWIPKITDFGLAKLLDNAESTPSGALMGTPSYMAPEQAEGRNRSIGPASDVYALGAVLYEMLTGRAPFRAATPLDTLMLVIGQDPVPPRRLQPGVPAALETICLKCLDKDPARRYASALELADDLARFQRGEPIRARPQPAWRRALRWARRRPGAAAAVLAVIVGLAASVALWGRAEQQRRRAEEGLHLARERLVRLQVQGGAARLEEGDLLSALPWFARALRNDPAGEAVHRVRLAAVLRRAPRLVRLWDHPEAVTRVVFSPVGRRLLICCDDGSARLEELASGKPSLLLRHDREVVDAAFSPDGKRLATASWDRTARVWDARSGAPLGPPLRHAGEVVAVAFSPGSERLVTVGRDGASSVWDLPTAGPPRRLIGLAHGGEAAGAGFSADGRRLLTWGGGRPTRVHDADSGKLLRELGGAGQLAAVGRAGRVVAVAAERTVVLWDLETGRQEGPALRHGGEVRFLAFSPDAGRLAAACADGNACLWDLTAGQLACLSLRHGASVGRAAFSRDGTALLTVGGQAARVWDARTGRPLSGPLPTNQTAWDGAFSPDGTLVATASGDRAARVWALPPRDRLTPPLAHDGEVVHAQFSPDGRLLATACGDGHVRLYDARTGRLVRPPWKHGSYVLHLAFHPAGDRLLSAADDGTARIWQVADGGRPALVLEHEEVRRVAFSPDGRIAVTAGGDGTARLWNTADGTPRGEPLVHGGFVFHAAFSPDGARLVTASLDGTARLWDATTGQPAAEPSPHMAGVVCAAFDASGSRVVSASQDRTARVWDARTGRLMAGPLRHQHEVRCALFSPDGRLVLTGGGDGAACLWDAATGALAAPPLRHAGAVIHAAFSPDGRLALTAGRDGQARLWDLTGQPVAPPFEHAGGVWHAAFQPEGRLLVTAGADRTAQRWDLRPDERPVEDLLRVTRLLAGLRLDDTGRAEALPVADLRADLEDLMRRYPEDFTLPGS